MRKICLGMLTGVGALLPVYAVAQTTYPERPIRIITGFVPGSPTDTIARTLGQKFTDVWAQPVVVENVPGAAGNIGAERVAKATPDGYTLGLLGQGQVVVNPSLYRLALNPEKDFAPVSLVALSPNMLVIHNGIAAKTVKDLVALAKAQPGELTYASGGTLPRLAAELFKGSTGSNIREIPYKGVTAALPDLLGGRVSMLFGPVAVSLPLVREGKLRALAVTSAQRSAAVKDLPTIAESGYPGFDVTTWFGLLAPASTRGLVIRKINLETVRIIALADVRTRFDVLGMEPIGSSPQGFADTVRAEVPKWAKVIRDAGIRPD